MFEQNSTTGFYYIAAVENMKRWRAERQSEASRTPHRPVIHIIPGDWGVATLEMTKKYGHIFAVLNMANATHPGGAYTHGAAAQEENMFRRSDCHFSIRRARDLHRGSVYNYNMQNLINGEHDKSLSRYRMP